MINSVTSKTYSNIAKVNAVRTISDGSEGIKLTHDKSDISKSSVGIKSYFVSDLIATGKMKELSAAFRTDEAYIQDNQVVLYDISKYKDLIPFELENNNIYAEVMSGEGTSTMTYNMWVKGPRGPMRIQAQAPCPDPKNHVMDEATFKNTVLKSFIIGSEYLKGQEDCGLGLADSEGIALYYDPTTKSIDTNKTLESYLGSYDFYTDGTITPEFRKHYTGARNLDANPAKVAEAKRRFQLIFDELLKLKL